jgi:hypothetical protein
MNGLALGGGFLNGLAQGLNDAALREEKINNWKIAQEAAKAQVEQMKFKASQEARKQNLIDMLLKGFEEKHQGMVQNEQQPAPPQPQPEGTPMGESFFNGNGPRPLPSMASSVPSQQSQAAPQGDRFLQMISDPRVLIALKESGLDVTSIAKMAQDKSELSPHVYGNKVVWTDKFGNIAKIQEADIPIKQEPMTTMDEQGNKIVKYINPYEKQEPAITERAKPNMVDVTIPGKGVFKVPFNPVTGQPFFGGGDKPGDLPPGTIATGPEELRTVTESTPGGGKREMTVGKYQPFSVQTELGASEGKPATPSDAGRTVLLEMGKKNVESLKSMIIKPDGSINRTLLMQMFGNVPGTKGREANAMADQALDAPIRFSTGAAINKEEMAFYRKMFIPSPLDSDATIKDKLTRLEDYMNTTINKIYPGKSPTPSPGGAVPKPKLSIEERLRQIRQGK